MYFSIYMSGIRHDYFKIDLHCCTYYCYYSFLLEVVLGIVPSECCVLGTAVNICI